MVSELRGWDLNKTKARHLKIVSSTEQYCNLDV